MKEHSITRNPNYIRTLTIAGSDCSGGAGIQADLKTFTTLGCYGMSVITALTAQNTQGVQSVAAVAPNFVCSQLTSVFQDITVDAVKIGMLHNEKVIAVVAKCMQRHLPKNLVIDPVMVAKKGHKLLQDDAIKFLKKELFPLATLITPNIPEAEILLQDSIRNLADMQAAAKRLADFGCGNVLLKGGHLLEAAIVDVLYIKHTNELHFFTNERILTQNTHGTGCTLSAAITAFLAKKMALISAVKFAKEYLAKAIESGSHYSLGAGHGPVNHLWNIDEESISRVDYADDG